MTWTPDFNAALFLLVQNLLWGHSQVTLSLDLERFGNSTADAKGRDFNNSTQSKHQSDSTPTRLAAEVRTSESPVAKQLRHQMSHDR